MAITTYTELQTALSNWFDDSGIAVAQYQECITLCEGDLKADTDLIETEVRATASLSTSSRYLSLPANYISGKRMRLIDPDDTDLVYQITFTTPKGIEGVYTTESFRPTVVSVSDGQFEFNSIPDKTYTSEFLYSRIAALSGSNATNEVFPNFLNAYLFGSLKYAAIYAKEDPLVYERQYEIFIDKIMMKNKRKKYPSPLKARSRYVK